MKLKFKFTKSNAIIVVMCSSLCISLIGFYLYFLALNNFVGISFPTRQKSMGFKCFWWIGSLGLTSFCVLSIINLVLLVPKRLSFVRQIPIINTLNPFFSSIKLVACFCSYMSIILTFFMFVCIFDITYSFNNKAIEFEYYVAEYDRKQNDVNHKVEPYSSSACFLDGKKYNWYADETMLNKDGSFTDEFISLYNEGINKVTLGKVFRCTDVINNLNENFYFSIQTVSTLGYGNITPNTSIGMCFVSIFVLLSSFSTIMVFGVVLGEKDD